MITFKAETVKKIKIVIYVTSSQMMSKAQLLKDNMSCNDYNIIIINSKDSNLCIQYRCNKSDSLLGVLYCQEIPEPKSLIQYAIISESVLNDITSHRLLSNQTGKNKKYKKRTKTYNRKYQRVKKKKKIEVK